MLLSAVNYIRGIVRIKIEGAHIERLLNICARNNIAFWKIERADPTIIFANVRIKGFKKLKKYARRSMCKIKIVKKDGAPFFFKKFKKRYALTIGFFAFIATLFILSRFIWTIEITGAFHTSSEKIMNNLEELGLKPGVLSSEVDVSDIKNRMLFKMGELSWLAVNIKGTHAEVEVHERAEKPYIIPKNSPCDIISTKPGLITSMIVREGLAATTTGNTVDAGDTLVSGTMTSETGGVRFVHSMAEVKARTWYAIRSVMPSLCSEKEYTGRVKRRLAIVLSNNRINLYLNDGNPFKFCDKIIKKEKLKLGKDFILPVAVVTESFVEYKEKKSVINFDEAKEILYNSLSQKLSGEISGGKVLKEDFKTKDDNTVIWGTLYSECEEEISMESDMKTP